MIWFFAMNTALACTWSEPKLSGVVELQPGVRVRYWRTPVTLTAQPGLESKPTRETALRPEWVIRDHDARIILRDGSLEVGHEVWSPGAVLELVGVPEPDVARVRSTWTLGGASVDVPCRKLGLTNRSTHNSASPWGTPATRVGPMQVRATAEPDSEVIVDLPAGESARVLELGVDGETHRIAILGQNVHIIGFTDTLGAKAPPPDGGVLGGFAGARGYTGDALRCKRRVPVQLNRGATRIPLGSWDTTESPILYIDSDPGNLRSTRAVVADPNVDAVLEADLSKGRCRRF